MEIDKKLYEDIKAFCGLNGLKPKNYINALLKKAFMEDKYGQAPFHVYKDPESGDTSFDNIPETVVEAKVTEIVKNMGSGDKEFGEFVEKVGGPDKYNDIVTECIFDDPKVEEKFPTPTAEELKKATEEVIKTAEPVKKPKKRTINVK